ncbi:M50 family metallopeptidase [Candidatus Woesearchaeota archaeon]|nr:M50 family metallopeptidase [Candidatus Woesearchaeota archaeon]
MIISWLELIYLVITTAVIAYIFMDMIHINRIQFLKPRFDWNAFKFAALVAAPGVILHELGHKFIAMFLGYTASFHIWPFGLFLGVFLKLIGSPFLIIAPGYVSITSVQNGLQNAIISFAGPFINLVLWLGSWLILNNARNLKRKTALFLYLTKQINMILFIFNMLPIPPLDGYQTLMGIVSLF